jgi:hypothetical protein
MNVQKPLDEIQPRMPNVQRVGGAIGWEVTARAPGQVQVLSDLARLLVDRPRPHGRDGAIVVVPSADDSSGPSGVRRDAAGDNLGGGVATLGK